MEAKASRRYQTERLLDYLETKDDQTYYDKFVDSLKDDWSHLVHYMNELEKLEAENRVTKKPFWKKAINNLFDYLSRTLVIRDFSASLISKDVLTCDQIEECTNSAIRARKVKVFEFIDILVRRTERDFEAFIKILWDTNYGHLAESIQEALKELQVEAQRLNSQIHAQESKKELAGDVAFPESSHCPAVSEQITRGIVNVSLSNKEAICGQDSIGNTDHVDHPSNNTKAIVREPLISEPSDEVNAKDEQLREEERCKAKLEGLSDDMKIEAQSSVSG